MTHGLTATFDFGGARVTVYNWHKQLLIFSYFIAAFLVLKILDVFRIAASRTALDIAFWGFAVSIFCIFALEEIFTGHEYPPIWHNTLTSQQLGVISRVGYYANAVSTASVLLFHATVMTVLATRIPAGAARAVRYIRSL